MQMDINPDAMDDVFKALADRGRRALLDALRIRSGQTLAELCSVLPEMSRFGVMKHLRIQEQAHLILSEKVGRTKQHHLNPVPIRQIHDRWISKYAAWPPPSICMRSSSVLRVIRCGTR